MNLYPKIILIMLLSTLTMAAQNVSHTTALPYSSPQVPESVMFCGKEIEGKKINIYKHKNVFL